MTENSTGSGRPGAGFQAPTPYEWPSGIRSAACFTVDVDAESPYLWGHRDGMPDTLGQLEARRFGPRQGVHRILDLLDRHGIRATFFVPGVVAEMHEGLLETVVARGHEIGLHGYFHEIVRESDDGEFVAALERSMEIFRKQTGRDPVGFRSPAWEMTPGMVAALKARGLAYDSSLMGYDHPYEIDGLTEIPVQWLVDDAIYFKFLGGGLDKWPPANPEGVLSCWQEEWRMSREFGGLFMLTVHPWISGRGQRIALLDRLLTTIGRREDLWWGRCDEIATHHAQSTNRTRFQATCDIPAAIGPRRKGHTP